MKLKNLLLVSVLSLAMLFSAVEADAQKKVVKNYKQSIGANPLGLAFGLLNATYEQQLSKNNSFTVSGLYWSIGSWTAWGLGGSYRWYLLQTDTGKRPLEGFSAGPLISFSSWSYDYDFDIVNIDEGINVAIGAEAGYKWIFGSGFMVEPTVSVSFGLTGVGDFTPFGLGVNLGYAW